MPAVQQKLEHDASGSIGSHRALIAFRTVRRLRPIAYLVMRIHHPDELPGLGRQRDQRPGARAGTSGSYYEVAVARPPLGPIDGKWPREPIHDTISHDRRLPVDLAQPWTDRYYSREEFRRWCEAQTKGRYERMDGRIVAMAPERGAHLRVKGAIYKALDRAVTAAGVPCQALPDGASVETGDSDYELDALVNCGEPMADDAVAAPNPVIIVEVLSPGTTSTDTGGKLADYFRVPSVAHYLIVHPIRRTVTHHRRTGDTIDTRIIVNGPITMDPPGIVITVEEIYGAA
jgi:Uma2 family endonuclease